MSRIRSVHSPYRYGVNSFYSVRRRERPSAFLSSVCSTKGSERRIPYLVGEVETLVFEQEESLGPNLLDRLSDPHLAEDGRTLRCGG